MHLFYVAVVCCWGGALRPPQPPPHHEICTSSPTPAPATKSHFKVNPLRQNTFSTNQPTNQPMQAHSAKATTNNQQEQEQKQATKQQTKQRVEIVRPTQSRSLIVFIAFNMHLFYVAVVCCWGGAQPLPNPRTTKSALYLQHPRLPQNHILR